MTRTILDNRPAEVGGGLIVRLVCDYPHPFGRPACTRRPHGPVDHINRDGNEWDDFTPCPKCGHCRHPRRCVGIVSNGWNWHGCHCDG